MLAGALGVIPYQVYFALGGLLAKALQVFLERKRNRFSLNHSLLYFSWKIGSIKGLEGAFLRTSRAIPELRCSDCNALLETLPERQLQKHAARKPTQAARKSKTATTRAKKPKQRTLKGRAR